MQRAFELDRANITFCADTHNRTQCIETKLYKGLYSQLDPNGTERHEGDETGFYTK